MEFIDLLTNLEQTISSIGTTSLVIMSIIIIVLIVLIIVEKKLREKITLKENTQSYYSIQLTNYVQQIKQTKTTDNKQTLRNLDKIAIKFFRENYKMRTSAGYTELKKFFEQKNDKQSQEFCDLITKTLYSGEKPSNEVIEKLTTSLLKIIQEKKSPQQKQQATSNEKKDKIIAPEKEKIPPEKIIEKNISENFLTKLKQKIFPPKKEESKEQPRQNLKKKKPVPDDKEFAPPKELIEGNDKQTLWQKIKTFLHLN